MQLTYRGHRYIAQASDLQVPTTEISGKYRGKVTRIALSTGVKLPQASIQHLIYRGVSYPAIY